MQNRSSVKKNPPSVSPGHHQSPQSKNPVAIQEHENQRKHLGVFNSASNTTNSGIKK